METENNLIQLRDQLMKQKWIHYNKFKELEVNITNLEKKIYKNCNHEWKEDDTDYGPYSKRVYICKFCNLYR